MTRRDVPAAVMRVRGRVLESPVVEYRHATTGAELLLILNCHMGTPAYWAEIRKLVGDRERLGWSVQEEGIREAPDAEWAAASPAEQAARRVMETLYADQPAAVAARIGWVYQEQGLPAGRRWVRIDMTDLEVIRSAGPAAILARGQANAVEVAKAGAYWGQWQAAVFPLAWRRQARPGTLVARAAARLVPAPDAGVTGVLVDQRSAVGGVADPDRNWVLLWGAGHEETIGAALAAGGWFPAGVRLWLPVGKLPPAARSLWGIVRAGAGVLVQTWRVTWAAVDAQKPGK